MVVNASSDGLQKLVVLNKDNFFNFSKYFFNFLCDLRGGEPGLRATSVLERVTPSGLGCCSVTESLSICATHGLRQPGFPLSSSVSQSFLTHVH